MYKKREKNVIVFMGDNFYYISVIVFFREVMINILF